MNFDQAGNEINKDNHELILIEEYLNKKYKCKNCEIIFVITRYVPSDYYFNEYYLTPTGWTNKNINCNERIIEQILK